MADDIDDVDEPTDPDESGEADSSGEGDAGDGNGDHVRVEGTHEPIVGREQFDRAQRMLGERQRDTSPFKATGERYILTGLCRCANCGHGMSGWLPVGRRDPQRQYVCVGYSAGGRAVCTRNAVSEAALLV